MIIIPEYGRCDGYTIFSEDVEYYARIPRKTRSGDVMLSGEFLNDFI